MVRRDRPPRITRVEKQDMSVDGIKGRLLEQARSVDSELELEGVIDAFITKFKVQTLKKVLKVFLGKKANGDESFLRGLLLVCLRHYRENGIILTEVNYGGPTYLEEPSSYARGAHLEFRPTELREARPQLPREIARLAQAVYVELGLEIVHRFVAPAVDGRSGSTLDFLPDGQKGVFYGAHTSYVFQGFGSHDDVERVMMMSVGDLVEARFDGRAVPVIWHADGDVWKERLFWGIKSTPLLASGDAMSDADRARAKACLEGRAPNSQYFEDAVFVRHDLERFAEACETDFVSLTANQMKGIGAVGHSVATVECAHGLFVTGHVYLTAAGVALGFADRPSKVSSIKSVLDRLKEIAA